MTSSLSNDVIRISPVLIENEPTKNTNTKIPKNTFPTWKNQIGSFYCCGIKSPNECGGVPDISQSGVRSNCNAEDETLPLNRSSDKRLKRNDESSEKYNYMELKSDYLKECQIDQCSSSTNKSVATTAILNSGDDDEMTITGYKRSKLRTILCWICFIMTAGLLRLFMHWRRHWLLLATHKICTLDTAEMLLIEEHFEGKYTLYYVKKVNNLSTEKTSQDLKNTKKTRLSCIPLEHGADGDGENASDGPTKFSLHLSGGEFKTMSSLRMFQCKHLRYVWDESSLSFVKLKGLDVNVPVLLLHQQKALDSETQNARREVYGLNQIFIPLKGIMTLLFLEALNPYYVFQVFSVCLWFSYDYYYYAIVIVLMSAFGITMSIVQTRKNQLALYKTVTSSDTAMVLQSNGAPRVLETKYLVPGDLLEIPSNGCTMQCDAVLLSGNCILDESMLTGESVPVTKTPLPCKRDLIFDPKEHSRHTLFSGTKVIQTRYIGTEKVLARVVNTGNITTKGGLIRSILYPPPVDYKFEEDSYKFIMLLGVIAGCGFIYTLFTKIYRGVSATKIAIESLDLITIAVPPALPAAMTVGRFYAQKRLEKSNIYCISPRSITVAGSIDCVCFDKTGTLTEDGLDMWGVVPLSSTNLFQIPLREVDRLPLEHLLFGMVTCHSITIMNGQLKGDPLDLKMFESTGWVLEEANVSDDNKYDLLFPTIVHPPRDQRTDSDMSSRQSSVDNIQDFDGINTLNGVNQSNFENNSLDIGIVREFSFTSSLQRMSVVTRKLGDSHFNVYTKGSPEMISSLCSLDTVPADFNTKLDYYAQQGYRVIAIAYKLLDKKMTYAKVQRIARENIECDLIFLGFVILENRLKPDTSSIINSLMDANVRTIMVTGDNILTALSVARDCHMLTNEQNVIIVSAKPRQYQNSEWELIYNLSGVSSSGDIRPSSLPQKQNGIIINTHDDISTGNTNDYMLLTTNSNSIASLETIDTCTQSTQITQRDIELGNVLNSKHFDAIYLNNNSDNNSPKLMPDLSFNNNYRFAMVGKTWSIIRDHYPELLPKFVTRGTVFARMSPDQKQSLILELQDLGYYVAMCGDGANDCGALKAAHTGISLSEAESSVASPFTSKNSTIACVPNVIKEGRCALVTSVAIFKYMAAYSLVQFASVLILYSIDSNLTDLQFLYIDLFMISVFAFFFGKTESYDGPLVKQTPLNSLISVTPIASLVIHLVLALGFQMFGWFHLQSQPWYQPFNYTEDRKYDHGCYENYTIFVISCFQYIILAIVFSKGAPYRKSILTNYGFLLSLTLNTIFSIIMAMAPILYITEKLQLIVPPDPTFSWRLIGFGLCNFILSLCIEIFFIENLLFRRLRYKFHDITKSHRKFLSIESCLRQMPSWPPISYIGGNSTKNNGLGTNSMPLFSNTMDKLSPLSNENDPNTPTSFNANSESECLDSFNKNNIVLKAVINHLDNSAIESSDDSFVSEPFEEYSTPTLSNKFLEITLNPNLLSNKQETALTSLNVENATDKTFDNVTKPSAHIHSYLYTEGSENNLIKRKSTVDDSAGSESNPSSSVYKRSGSDNSTSKT